MKNLNGQNIFHNHNRLLSLFLVNRIRLWYLVGGIRVGLKKLGYDVYNARIRHVPNVILVPLTPNFPKSTIF